MKGKETTSAAGRREEIARDGYRVGLRERTRLVAEIRARGRQRSRGGCEGGCPPDPCSEVATGGSRPLSSS